MLYAALHFIYSVILYISRYILYVQIEIKDEIEQLSGV